VTTPTLTVAAAARELAGLVPESVLRDETALLDRYARALWSTLTEPGDGVAGGLVQLLGPVPALEAAFGSDTALGPLAHDLGDLEKARRRWRPRLADGGHALAVARQARVELVTPLDQWWPHRLDDLGRHAPHCLWVRGDPRALSAPAGAIALVGARAASFYGEQIAGQLAAELAATGITIVSGGAYGIDSAAHHAALQAGGPTVALMAGGVERPYPAGHRDLLDRIAGRGAVASEVPCGSTPTKWRFLQRNRNIAALADATVVVEAGWRSGTLNTAGHAASLGRPLGAVPGPVTSATSAGCHRLLREYDARCVTTSAEVRELLGFETGSPCEDASRTDDRTRVLDALSTRAGRDDADIARRSGLAVDEVQAVLGLLSLDGTAVRSDTGWRRPTH